LLFRYRSPHIGRGDKIKTHTATWRFTRHFSIFVAPGSLHKALVGDAVSYDRGKQKQCQLNDLFHFCNMAKNPPNTPNFPRYFNYLSISQMTMRGDFSSSLEISRHCKSRVCDFYRLSLIACRNDHENTNAPMMKGAFWDELA